MLSNLLLVLASTAALVNSQSTSSIDPNSVDIKTRRKSPTLLHGNTSPVCLNLELKF
jgi:hypothetical protein